MSSSTVDITYEINAGRESLIAADNIHAFKLAFVHDELYEVFRVRARMLRHGVATLRPVAFRKRAKVFKEEDLVRELESRTFSFNRL